MYIDQHKAVVRVDALLKSLCIRVLGETLTLRMWVEPCCNSAFMDCVVFRITKNAHLVSKDLIKKFVKKGKVSHPSLRDIQRQKKGGKWDKLGELSGKLS
jgi:hypothetical protein